MLIFTCPYCEEPLRVPHHYVGHRGKCKKCGGRIALLGDPELDTPQRASRVEEAAEEPEQDKGDLPATERQLDYLRVLGAREDHLENLSRNDAARLIEELKNERRDHEPPTEDQLDYLRRLGLNSKEIVKVSSKTEASFLIERLQPPPTDHQMNYLRRLGARPEHLAGVRTKSDAAALIEQFLSKGHTGHSG